MRRFKRFMSGSNPYEFISPSNGFPAIVKFTNWVKFSKVSSGISSKPQKSKLKSKRLGCISNGDRLSSMGFRFKFNRVRLRSGWKMPAGSDAIWFESRKMTSRFFIFSKCRRFKVEISLCERYKTFKFSQHSSKPSSSICCRLLWLKLSCCIVFGMFFGIAESFRFEQSKMKFELKLHGNIAAKIKRKNVYFYVWDSGLARMHFFMEFHCSTDDVTIEY